MLIDLLIILLFPAGLAVSSLLREQFISHAPFLQHSLQHWTHSIPIHRVTIAVQTVVQFIQRARQGGENGSICVRVTERISVRSHPQTVKVLHGWLITIVVQGVTKFVSRAWDEWLTKLVSGERDERLFEVLSRARNERLTKFIIWGGIGTLALSRKNNTISQIAIHVTRDAQLTINDASLSTAGG